MQESTLHNKNAASMNVECCLRKPRWAIPFSEFRVITSEFRVIPTSESRVIPTSEFRVVPNSEFRVITTSEFRVIHNFRAQGYSPPENFENLGAL